MKGAYVLLIELSKMARIFHKGTFYELPTGIYVYVGSALGHANAIESRVTRHLKKSKKLFWHIDKITSSPEARISSFFSILADTSIECTVSQKLFASGNFSVPIPKFGASDCKKGCPAHFYYCRINNLSDCISVIRSILCALANTVLFCTVEGTTFSCKIINRTCVQKLM